VCGACVREAPVSRAWNREFDPLGGSDHGFERELGAQWLGQESEKISVAKTRR
jgi:hypothetical protein